MTTAADDRAIEDAFEALLAGRPAPGGAAGLAAFTGAVRTASAAPGRPSAALADLLSTGLRTDQPGPSTRTLPAAGTARSHRRRSWRPPVLTALVAKFLSAGAVAHAAAGAGVVVVLTAGAGAAGVLPGDAQTAFAELTGSTEDAGSPTGDVRPVDEEAGEPVAGDGSRGGTDPTGADPVPRAGEAVPGNPAGIEPSDEQEWYRGGPDPEQTFGQWVSEGRRNGWATGARVSEWAHGNKDRDSAGTEELQVEVPEVEVPDVEVPEVEVPEVEVPEVEVPEVEVPEAEVPGVEVPQVGLPGLRVPEVLGTRVDRPAEDESGDGSGEGEGGQAGGGEARG